MNKTQLESLWIWTKRLKLSEECTIERIPKSLNKYIKQCAQPAQTEIIGKKADATFIFLCPAHPQGSGQVLLGTQAHVCLGIALPLAEAFSIKCPKWGFSFQHIFDILLHDSFGIFKPTLIVRKSFPTVLAGAPDSLCTAAPKDNTNDTDQLLLEEVFLDQLCWCSSIPGSTKQVSAARRGYFWDDLQWAAEFQGWQGVFCGFFWGNPDYNVLNLEFIQQGLFHAQAQMTHWISWAGELDRT